MGIIEDIKDAEPVLEIPIKIKYKGKQKDGLDIYEYDNIDEYEKFGKKGNVFYCPICWKRFPDDEQKRIFSLRLSRYKYLITKYYELVNSDEVDIFDELRQLASQIEEKRKSADNKFYKHFCNQTKKALYIKLYMPPYPKLEGDQLGDYRYHYNFWRKNESVIEQLLKERREEVKRIDKELELQRKRYKEEMKKKREEERRRREEAAEEPYQQEYCNGFRLCGRVQVVDYYPDIRVQIVDYHPDIRVKKVEYTPERIGEWYFVDYSPDFKIEYVDYHPDLKIKFVDIL